jgi:hypothetical protein
MPLYSTHQPKGIAAARRFNVGYERLGRKGAVERRAMQQIYYGRHAINIKMLHEHSVRMLIASCEWRRHEGRVAAAAALTSPLPRAGHASFSKKEDVRTAARPSQVENVSS